VDGAEEPKMLLIMSQATSNVTPSGKADPGKTWRVPYYVRGLALGVPIYLAAIHLWTWALYVPDFLVRGGLDFRQSYSAAYMLRTGRGSELYNYEAQKRYQNVLVSQQNIPLPFVEPAYEAVLFEPLSRFSFRAAYFFFLGVNVALLCLCCGLLKPWLANLHAVYWWLPYIMFVGFLPIAVALIQGQDAILLTTGFVVAFVLLVRDRKFLAGIALGLTIFKFQIVLPVAVLFLVWRQLRFVAGFATSATIALGIGFWRAGIVQTKAYFSLLLSLSGLKPPLAGFDSYPISWNGMSCVHGIVFSFGQGHASHRALTIVSLALSFAILGWTAFRGSSIKSAATQLLLACLCGVLVGHHVNIYDLSILLLPIFVVLNAFLPKEQSGRRVDRAIAVAAALMFSASLVFSFFPSHFSLAAFVEVFFLVAIALAGAEGFNPAHSEAAG